MRPLRRWKRLWWRSLTRSAHKRTSMGPSRSFSNSTTSALQPEEITSKGTRVSCVCIINKSAHTKKSLETYLMILVYIYIYIYDPLLLNLGEKMTNMLETFILVYVTPILSCMVKFFFIFCFFFTLKIKFAST